MRDFVAVLHKALQGFFWEVCLFLGAAGLRTFAVSGSQGSLSYSVHFSSLSKRKAADLGKIQRGWQGMWKNFPVNSFSTSSDSVDCTSSVQKRQLKGDRVKVCKIELHRDGEWGAAAHCFFCSNLKFRWEGQNKQKVVTLNTRSSSAVKLFGKYNGS